MFRYFLAFRYLILLHNFFIKNLLANLNFKLQQCEEEATRELSLSEWRIWQNRPFPTSMVDHSDRCYHFISVMEMIELIRHEQVRCLHLAVCKHAQVLNAHLD